MLIQRDVSLYQHLSWMFLQIKSNLQPNHRDTKFVLVVPGLVPVQLWLLLAYLSFEWDRL